MERLAINTSTVTSRLAQQSTATPLMRTTLENRADIMVYKPALLAHLASTVSECFRYQNCTVYTVLSPPTSIVNCTTSILQPSLGRLRHSVYSQAPPSRPALLHYLVAFPQFIRTNASPIHPKAKCLILARRVLGGRVERANECL
jgi:hypothetical protein